jgi:hypothetical protein
MALFNSWSIKGVVEDQPNAEEQQRQRQRPQHHGILQRPHQKQGHHGAASADGGNADALSSDLKTGWSGIARAIALTRRGFATAL